MKKPLADIANTDWAKRFKAESPTIYEEAIRLVEKVDAVVIEQRDDHGPKGEFLWAIIPDCNTEFWLDALPTKKAAIAVCREMNWRIRGPATDSDGMIKLSVPQARLLKEEGGRFIDTYKPGLKLVALGLVDATETKGGGYFNWSINAKGKAVLAQKRVGV